MTSIEKINLLLDKVENRINNLPSQNSTSPLREHNLSSLKNLFDKLNLSNTNFDNIFNYTAINLAGIGLKSEEFGEIREGKYVQIIAISYEINSNGKKITKNSSLGYYGKAEKLKEEEKNNIIEFVLRWRYEKTFQHSDYYQLLLEKLH